MSKDFGITDLRYSLDSKLWAKGESEVLSMEYGVWYRLENTNDSEQNFVMKTAWGYLFRRGNRITII
jgi:hypothetical protein